MGLKGPHLVVKGRKYEAYFKICSSHSIFESHTRTFLEGARILSALPPMKSALFSLVLEAGCFQHLGVSQAFLISPRSFLAVTGPAIPHQSSTSADAEAARAHRSVYNSTNGSCPRSCFQKQKHPACFMFDVAREMHYRLLQLETIRSRCGIFQVDHRKVLLSILWLNTCTIFDLSQRWLAFQKISSSERIMHALYKMYTKSRMSRCHVGLCRFQQIMPNGFVCV